MKSKYIISIIVLFSFHFLAVGQSNIIEIPIVTKSGFGDLSPRYKTINGNPLREDSPWKKTEVKLTGIPDNWNDTNSEQIWFDSDQFAYQNYHQGNLTKAFFNSLIESWEIDTLDNLSKKPIKCFTHIIIGKVSEDSLVFRLDTDYDNDFSDEITYSPILIDKIDSSLIKNERINVSGEFFLNNKILQKDIPILVVQDKYKNIYLNFPQYYETNLEGQPITLTNMFSALTFRNRGTFIKLKNDNNSALVPKGEFLNINGSYYKNLGADIRTMTLQLEKLENDSVIYSSQVDSYAYPFKGKIFNTESIFNTEDLKGKYLFLDFWGSWCKPCINELKNLKYAYENLDKDKIEFISIAEDTPENLNKAIKEYGITWNQILSTKSNNIVKLYGVNAFPTTLLIDKSGKIIIKDIRGENLLEIIKENMK